MYLVDRFETRDGTGPNSKPELDEDLLMHFGVRGMHWGVRRGRKKTGLTRHRGATVDRNERLKYEARMTLAGKRHKISGRMARKMMGEASFKRRINANIKELNAQNRRLKEGKVTVEDRLDMMMSVTPLSLVMTSRPKT